VSEDDHVYKHGCCNANAAILGHRWGLFQNQQHEGIQCDTDQGSFIKVLKAINNASFPRVYMGSKGSAGSKGGKRMTKRKTRKNALKCIKYITFATNE
jgi:hypothetical protein